MTREELKIYIHRYHTKALTSITKYERGEIDRDRMCRDLWLIFRDMTTKTTGHHYKTKRELEYEEYLEALESGGGDWMWKE